MHSHEHFQLEISSKCVIKAENSSTLCKFHEGRKGLGPMGSNADRSIHVQTLTLTALSVRCKNKILS